MVAWEAVRELLETLNRGRVVVLEGSFSWGGGGQTAASSASAAASSLRTIGRFSRFFGLDDLFRTKLLYLLNLGYALRIRLPLFISAGFVVCHFLSNYVPQVVVPLQVVVIALSWRRLTSASLCV